MNKTIDLHGYSIGEAKVIINQTIKHYANYDFELTIIHGYSSTILQNYIRKSYQHPQLKRKILTMNPGQTIFIIRGK